MPEFEFDTTPERSRMMSGIRSRNTQPELALRRALWAQGIRGYRKHPALPGKPDLLFTRWRVVVFVDGCFWHGCPLHHTLPRSNVTYWQEKLQRNRRRDAEVNATLAADGYRVLRLWEHEVKADPEAAAQRVRQELSAAQGAVSSRRSGRGTSPR